MSTKAGRLLINPGSTGGRDNSQTLTPGASLQSARNTGRRVTISDLQYFVAKADTKLKKLRASLGDYDSQDIEHHKVLKTIFSLVKKLLRLPSDDASKEFMATYNSRVLEQTTNNAKMKMYDSSGSSGSESHLQAGSDYFPTIQGGGPNNNGATLGSHSNIMPQVRQSPFVAGKNQTNSGGNTDQGLKNSKIVIKSNHTPGGKTKQGKQNDLENLLNMSAN